MDSINLHGAEEVARAGYNMKSAAEQMNRAAAQIDESLRTFMIRFEELVMRMEEAAKPQGEDNASG